MLHLPFDRNGVGLRISRRPCEQISRDLDFAALDPRICLALDVPALSSLPGANHTIYLDYNGHVTTGTSWNSYFNQSTINSPAYSSDSDANNFSSAELAAIESSWERIAEDFIPFHVNVTTVDPGIEALRKVGTGDMQWGIRVVITKDTVGCGCGGIAYINSFNWDSDTPTFVFNTGEKAIAEAASHEVGHSLGLAHDGTSSTGYYTGHGSGETGWAPLMGVGYYQNVSQWDKGEYYNSNNAGSNANYNKGPDDLAVITTYNGFGYRLDDHGNSQGTATSLTVNGTNVSGAGIIERRTDVDVFRFSTGTGTVSLNLNPFSPGPNLDIKADLYNSSWSLVATSDSVSTLSASFSLNLAAGDYFLVVDGTGYGSPGSNPPTGFTDYASLGQYTINGTVVGQPTSNFSIGDTSFAEASGGGTITVTLSSPLAVAATVDYSMGGGTATAGSDYQATSGTLNFAPGETSKFITLGAFNDSTSEPHETFFVTLSNPSSGAGIADGVGLVTILNDDGAFVINDFSGNEGNPSTGPTTSFVFTVSLLHPTILQTAISFRTMKGSATENVDYIRTTGRLQFAPGETNSPLTVSVITDTNVEPNETFRVVLITPKNAIISDNTGWGTIINDDTPSGAPPGGGEPPGNIGGFSQPCGELPFWDSTFSDVPPPMRELFGQHDDDHDHHHHHQFGYLPGSHQDDHARESDIVGHASEWHRSVLSSLYDAAILERLIGSAQLLSINLPERGATTAAAVASDPRNAAVPVVKLVYVDRPQSTEGSTSDQSTALGEIGVWLLETDDVADVDVNSMNAIVEAFLNLDE